MSGWAGGWLGASASLRLVCQQCNVSHLLAVPGFVCSVSLCLGVLQCMCACVCVCLFVCHCLFVCLLVCLCLYDAVVVSTSFHISCLHLGPQSQAGDAQDYL